MNSSSQKDSLSLRQRDLQRKIFQALNVNDTETFVALESQWVHRYGLETLPSDENLRDLFQDDTFISEEVIENNSLFEQEKIIPEKFETPIGIEEKKQIFPDEESVSDDEIIPIDEQLEEEKVDMDEEINPMDKIYDSQSDNDSCEVEPIENNLTTDQDESLEIETESNFNYDELIDSVDSGLNNESNSRENINGQYKEMPAQPEVINVPPPPPPSLDNLRRWLN